MARTPGLDVNPIIHERVRLAILTYLASSDGKEVPFTELRDKLELTAGNLSVQLRNLESAGYLVMVKGFTGRKPLTLVTLTLEGQNALQEYIGEMERIIEAIKGREQ